MANLKGLLAVCACIASAFGGAAFERGKLAFQVSSPDRHTVVIRNMEAESTEGPMCALMLEGGETATISAVIHDPEVTGPCGPGVSSIYKDAPQSCDAAPKKKEQP